jgi:hypothetical protein
VPYKHFLALTKAACVETFQSGETFESMRGTGNGRRFIDK